MALKIATIVVMALAVLVIGLDVAVWRPGLAAFPLACGALHRRRSQAKTLTG